MLFSTINEFVLFESILCGRTSAEEKAEKCEENQVKLQRKSITAFHIVWCWCWCALIAMPVTLPENFQYSHLQCGFHIARVQRAQYGVGKNAAKRLRC